MEKKIRLIDNNAVSEFVRAADRCDFDIDLTYDRVIVDGKSLLGVLGMDRKKVLTARYDGNNDAFDAVLNKYAISDKKV